MIKEEFLEGIEFAEKWLSDAGYTAYNVEIAFDGLRRVVNNATTKQPVKYVEEGCEDRIEMYPLCPRCEKELNYNYTWNFCPYCGTPIDWGRRIKCHTQDTE